MELIQDTFGIFPCFKMVSPYHRLFVFYLQNTPFRELKYELLGDDKGPSYFAIEPKTGRVTIRNDLKSDSDIQYQVLTLVICEVYFNRMLLKTMNCLN